MNKTELEELKIFINDELNIDLSICQETILKNIVGDRVIGFIRSSDELIDLTIYKLLYDMVYKGHNTFVYNLNDVNLNQYAFTKIIELIQYLELDIDTSEIIRLDDVLIIDYLQIYTNDENTKQVDSYTIYNIFDNEDILEMVDSIIYDKHQNFLIMDIITKLVPLFNSYSDIINTHVFSTTYKEYHNCNYEVIQEVHCGKKG